MRYGEQEPPHQWNTWQTTASDSSKWHW